MLEMLVAPEGVLCEWAERSGEEKNSIALQAAGRD